MPETITVRDHSRPCEHGSLWPHWFEVRKAKWWQEPDCYGGNEMVLKPLADGIWQEAGSSGDESATVPGG